MSLIHIEKPYQECINFAGMRGTGKSNAMADLLQNTSAHYILIDTAGAFKKGGFTPSFPDTQKIVRFRQNQRLEQFERLLKEVYIKGNTIVAIEEVDRYETVYKMLDILDEVINVGRNRGVALWMSFRRPARVHKDLIGNAEHHFIFRLFDVASIKWYKDATGCPFIEQAKNLQPYHFFYWKIGKDPVVMKPMKKVI